MASTPREILEAAYTRASDSPDVLSETQQYRVNVIIERSESQKAVLAALMTSLVKKIDSPKQDIRQHKVELPGGYSGRVYDTTYVTPFIREKFPRLAMKSGSGWLTRSIEQVHAFNLDFPGRIANAEVKRAFLEILDGIQTKGENAEDYLIAVLDGLLTRHQAGQSGFVQTDLGGVSIVSVVDALDQHFSFNYKTAGASRLPVIAIYSVYEMLVKILKTYKGKRLASLKSHTTSDTKSHSIGDIEVLNKDGSFFEAVEIKSRIPITLTMAEDAYEKIQSMKVARYFLLTTAEPNTHDLESILDFSEQVRRSHGCEMIVNGVLPTIKYYLRLINDSDGFLHTYENNLLADYEANTDIKRAHLEKWIELRDAL